MQEKQQLLYEQEKQRALRQREEQQIHLLKELLSCILEQVVILLDQKCSLVLDWWILYKSVLSFLIIDIHPQLLILDQWVNFEFNFFI